MLDLLKGRSVQAVFTQNQTCCGLPALMAAEEETAVKLARQNIDAFQAVSCDYILTLCASCASHIKHFYTKLVANTGFSAAHVRNFSDKIIDFSSFMVNTLKVAQGDFKKSNKKVAYHAPCHLCRGLYVIEEPRRLIEIAGLRYVPSPDEDVCCGFGGSYSVDFPEISAEILKKKLDNVEQSGAEILVTDCPGCVLQLRGGMDKRKGGIVVKHISEAVAKQLMEPHG